MLSQLAQLVAEVVSPLLRIGDTSFVECLDFVQFTLEEVEEGFLVRFDRVVQFFERLRGRPGGARGWGSERACGQCDDEEEVRAEKECGSRNDRLVVPMTGLVSARGVLGLELIGRGVLGVGGLSLGELAKRGDCPNRGLLVKEGVFIRLTAELRGLISSSPSSLDLPLEPSEPELSLESLGCGSP